MLDLSATLELRRAGDYASPRKQTALLPVVYGDMSLGGGGGLWEAVCLDKDAFVYALAGHALRPVAAGNAVALFDGDGQMIDPSAYSLDLAHDFEGRGVIATATFGEDAQALEPITVRAQGRTDEEGGLIANPVEVVRDLLLGLSGAEGEDLDQAAFSRARARAESLGFAAAGVIAKQASLGNLVTAVLADFLGSWWLGGNGSLRMFLDLGAGSLSESDIAACLRQGDLSGVSVQATLADMVNRAPVSYAYNFAAKEYQGYFDGLETQDLRAQGLHGVAATTLELPWVRAASVARAVSQRLVGLLGRPRRVIACQENSLINLPLEKGDAVLFGLSWLLDPQGRPLKNQIVRVLGLEPDLDAGTVGYTLLDTGLYKTLAALADGRGRADGSLEAGGGRDRNDY
ncbi:MAG: hypothetical protein KMY53_15675 [Desulfarculus sp.]|nr:hypothetical protein [Pseudomonadota bacterium]MBV1718339.1 hypothetical protein [Desulfarculus sp.]MBU4576896.1 hypothetical protein [Pseudomonadota bacterium]MBU4596310.1 hypothetical protein [Pseudomonadota bacterium]MBV1739607.1 hypothetical protein [Desulfarculus sp.]